MIISWVVLKGYIKWDAKRTFAQVEARAVLRQKEILEMLKTKKTVIDKVAVKQAAEEFMDALKYWKSEKKVRAVASLHRPDWRDEDIMKSLEHIAAYVNPVIDIFQPIYELAIKEEIDEPFSFRGYIRAPFTGFYWDELSYPEIETPLDNLAELLRGGLTHEEFWETDYYKKNLLPKKFKAG